MTWKILLFQAVTHNICPWIHAAYALFWGKWALWVCVSQGGNEKMTKFVCTSQEEATEMKSHGHMPRKKFP